MSKLLLGAVAGTALLLSAPVFAADLNEPIPQAPYAPPVTSSAFDWTGAYVGANVAQVTPLVGGPVGEVLVDDTA